MLIYTAWALRGPETCQTLRGPSEARKPSSPSLHSSRPRPGQTPTVRAPGGTPSPCGSMTPARLAHSCLAATPTLPRAALSSSCRPLSPRELSEGTPTADDGGSGSIFGRNMRSRALPSSSCAVPFMPQSSGPYVNARVKKDHDAIQSVSHSVVE